MTNVSMIDGHIDEPKGMSDEEIIKTWEKCANPANDCYGDDYTCPYGKYDKGTGECFKRLREDVTELLNRQKAELSKKDTEIDILIRKKETLNDEISELKAEIERLQRDCADIDKFARDVCKERLVQGNVIADYETLQLYIKNQKIEAIKEFAERLKEKAEKHDCTYYLSEYRITAVAVEHIDNLVKEMTEGK